MTPHTIGTLIAAVLTAAWALCGLSLVGALIGLAETPPPPDRQRRRLLVAALVLAGAGAVIHHLWTAAL